VAAGQEAEARRALASLGEVEKNRYVGHVLFASAHAALGDTETAVLRLERAFDERDPQLPFIKILWLGTFWEPVLADARVQALIRKIGLPA
jgi:hypothetical protein